MLLDFVGFHHNCMSSGFGMMGCSRHVLSALYNAERKTWIGMKGQWKSCLLLPPGACKISFHPDVEQQITLWMVAVRPQLLCHHRFQHSLVEAQLGEQKCWSILKIHEILHIWIFAKWVNPEYHRSTALFVGFKWVTCPWWTAGKF